MPRLLIIDAEAGIRQVISRVLAPHGYALLTADDGAQGIAAHADNAIDLVLADPSLNDMDGKELLARLREAKPAVPVLFMAGFADLDTAVELVRLGAAGYITKPFKVNDLVYAVQQALNKKTMPSAAPEVPAPPGVSATATQKAPASPSQPSSSARLQKISRSSRMKLMQRFWIPAVVVALGIALAAAVPLLRKPPGAAFALPYSNPSGMCWDGKNIWISDWVEGKVYRHVPDAAFSVAATISTPNIEPAGLAVDGKNLWIVHTLGRKIYRGAQAATFTALQSFESPGPGPSGAYFDQTYLWSLDLQNAKIYRHSPTAKDLAVLAVYDSPAMNPCSMFAYKGDLWIADAATNRIYRVSAVNFAIKAVYAVVMKDGPSGHFSAVACDGRNLWITCDGLAKVYCIPVKNLRPIKS